MKQEERDLIVIIIILFFVTSLTACGSAEQLGKNCGGDFKELCLNVLGGRISNAQQDQIYNTNKDAEALKQAIIALYSEIIIIKVQMQFQAEYITTVTNSLQVQINALNDTMADLDSAGESSQNEINDLMSQIAALKDKINAANNNIALLQTASNQALIQIATLTGYKNIVAVYDPCGPQGSWNEVLLQLSDGKYLASFSDNSNGANTRFVELQDGSYVTTDNTHCYFTASQNGTVIIGEHN